MTRAVPNGHDQHMSADVVDALRQLLGSRGVLTDPSDCERFERGWRYGRGRARCVARPATTDEVAATLRRCHEQRIRVVPQGANTGLVAASTPDDSGDMVVLSLERLSRTIDVDVAGRTATGRWRRAAEPTQRSVGSTRAVVSSRSRSRSADWRHGGDQHRRHPVVQVWRRAPGTCSASKWCSAMAAWCHC